MTSNQINYLMLQETKRHNVTTETETGRHNVVTEDVMEKQYQEQVRHNKATEEIDLFKASVQQQTLDETKRANLVREDQLQQQIDETVRHNFGTENLQLRSIVETERNNQVMNAIGMLNAQAAQTNASANLYSAYELNRHNEAQELIGMKTQQEVMRHNKETEALQLESQNITRFQSITNAGIGSTNAGTNILQQSEQGRHNLAQEGFNTKSLWVNTSVEMLRMANNTINTLIRTAPSFLLGGK